MKVATRRNAKTSSRVCNNKKQPRKLVNTKKQNHPKFGTSKLEVDFARDFLDKLKLKYVWQFEAKDIGRYFDYAVILSDNNKRVNGDIVLIEIDGGYFHSDPRVVDESKLNPMQKHNKRVDEIKNKWALMHGIPIIRFWEKDIRENPRMVMNELKKKLGIEKNKMLLKEEKTKRHINKLKTKSNGS